MGRKFNRFSWVLKILATPLDPLRVFLCKSYTHKSMETSPLVVFEKSYMILILYYPSYQLTTTLSLLFQTYNVNSGRGHNYTDNTVLLFRCRRPHSCRGRRGGGDRQQTSGSVQLSNNLAGEENEPDVVPLLL